MTTETLDMHDMTEEEIRVRNHIQMEVMKYAMNTRNLTEMEWVDAYGYEFKMFFNDAIVKGYQEAEDDNLETFLEWIQVRLENMALQKAA